MVRKTKRCRYCAAILDGTEWQCPDCSRKTQYGVDNETKSGEMYNEIYLTDEENDYENS